MISPSRLLIISIIAWLIGTIFPLRLMISTGTTAAGIVIILLTLINRRNLIGAIGLFLTVLLMGSYYTTHYHQGIIPQPTFNQKQAWQLTILDRPTKDNDQARYIGKTEEGWKIQFTLPRQTAIPPGTQLAITGTLLPLNQNGDDRYALAMSRHHAFGKLRQPQIINQAPVTLNPWEQLLISSQSYFHTTVQRLFADPQSALFAGIVAGITTDLPNQTLDDFKITGLSHLIAVSGFNVTIVITLFAQLTRRFGRLLNLLLCGLAIFSFVIFTGASASVTRAGILAGLSILTRALGRQVSLLRLLLYTAFIMTLHNPLISRYDIGFQLSFLAVLGLVFLSSPIQSILMKWRFPTWLAEMTAATMAAQLATFPIINYYFGTLSPYALPANLLVGPFIPLITISGFPLVFTSSLIPWLSWLALPFDILLRYCLTASHLIAELPYANLTLPQLSLWIWLPYCLILYLWCRRWQRNELACGP